MDRKDNPFDGIYLRFGGFENFNNGQVTIKEISAYFGKMLGIEIKDPSGCYVNMRERVQESRTTYIDSMRDALLERMEKDDEKLYRRKK